MKITRNANNKKQVKLSKKDWEDFGKKAGWLDENGKLIVKSSKKIESKEIERESQSVDVIERAAPAPAAPKTKPKTTPKEKPAGRPTRRRFPRPPASPPPKGEEKDIVEFEEKPLAASAENLPTISSELKKNLKLSNFKIYFQKLANYERDAHRYNQNFWENIPPTHAFFHNPVIKDHGKELAKENYNYLKGRHGELDITSLAQLMQKLVGLVSQIKQKEAGHEEDLIELAKDIVSEEWNIDKSMLDGRNMDEPGESGKPERYDGVDVEIDERLRQEVNKRIILNTIAQGAGLHALLTMHHLGADKINEIDPELMGLYDEFANLISQHYFVIDMAMVEAMADQLGQTGTGWAHTEYPDADAPEKEMPKVVAQGINFSVLCQELVKGVVGMATDHGLSNESRKGEELTDEQIKAILNESDQLVFEPWEIQIGPELWRRFLKVTPEGADKFDLISEISTTEPEDVYEVSSDTITNPGLARQRLAEYQEAIEQFDMVDVPTGDEANKEEILEVEEETDIHPDLKDVNVEEELKGLLGPQETKTKGPQFPGKKIGPIEELQDIAPEIPPYKINEKGLDKPFWMN